MGTSVSVSESDEMRRAGATRFLDGLVCGADSVGVVALCLDGCCDRLGRMVSEIENETATVCMLMQCNVIRLMETATVCMLMQCNVMTVCMLMQ